MGLRAVGRPRLVSCPRRATQEGASRSSVLDVARANIVRAWLCPVGAPSPPHSLKVAILLSRRKYSWAGNECPPDACVRNRFSQGPCAGGTARKQTRVSCIRVLFFAAFFSVSPCSAAAVPEVPLAADPSALSPGGLRVSSSVNPLRRERRERGSRRAPPERWRSAGPTSCLRAPGHRPRALHWLQHTGRECRALA